MKEKKKRSKLGSMWDVLVDAVHEPILKHKDKLNVKAAGVIVGKAASIVAKPAVQLKAPPVKEEETSIEE